MPGSTATRTGCISTVSCAACNLAASITACCKRLQVVISLLSPSRLIFYFAAGVIIPLLAELDPASPSELFMNWDMARCLKWGYADKISMRKVFMSELSVAASQVEVPADANIMAATIMAAAKVRHSQLCR
jgi:hypothetical protein